MAIGITDIVAWIGALTGIGALIWQITTWRKSLHNVKVTVGNAFFTYANGSVGDHMISVTARNKGSAPVTITGWAIEIGDTKENANQLAVIQQATTLPHRLENGAEANFYVPAAVMIDAHAKRGLPYSRMRPWVQLATGQKVFAAGGLKLKD